MFGGGNHLLLTLENSSHVSESPQVDKLAMAVNCQYQQVVRCLLQFLLKSGSSQLITFKGVLEIALK